MRSIQFSLWYRYRLFKLLGCLCFIFPILFKYACFIKENRCIIVDNQLSTLYAYEAIDEADLFMVDISFNTFEAFYARATIGRNSSFPFISGDTFRAMADHIFDETTNISQWRYHVSTIGRGDTVFLSGETEMMKLFFENPTFGQIRRPFILITHNSDASAPTNVFKWVLDEDKIVAWFASNPDYAHKKLFPIPIGMANTRWPHGNVNNFKRAFYQDRKPFHKRTTLLYVNFKVENNRKSRSKALKWALSLRNVAPTQATSHEIYLRELGNAKFVLSPPGNGLDCHRTWEAILMGAVPIVLRSPLDSLFSNIPVLIVDDWSYLTQEYLESLHYNTVLNERLFARYWYRRLKNVQVMMRPLQVSV